MNKLEIKNLVKEAIQEIKQENLQQEGKLGKILGGVAFIAALLAGNAKLDQNFYKNDPQIIQLEKDLLKAKESGDKEKIKDIARKLKNRKIVVTPFK
jgi:mannitol-1-phosphate/altronate dehydrogenase